MEYGNICDTRQMPNHPHVRQNKNLSGRHYPGQAIIVDLGREGIDMYEGIHRYLDNTADYRDNYASVCKLIHKTITDDLIRFLNVPPTEALNRVLNLEGFTFYLELVGMIENRHVNVPVREKDVFIEFLKPLVLKTYMRIRSQFKVQMNVEYRPERVGLDYIVIREYKQPGVLFG